MNLQSKLKRRVKGMRKQLRKWKATGKRGYLKLFRVHKKAVKKLRVLIKAQLTQVKWISDKGASFIAEFEGMFLKPYNDPAGFATVGIGHLIAHRPVNAEDHDSIWITGQQTRGRLTRREALKLLQVDLRNDYEPAVRKLFKSGPLRGKWDQAFYDSLVSVVYNLGVGAVQGAPGFETLTAAIQSGSKRQIANALPLYVRGGGQVLPGLVRRRNAEAHLILTGKYHQ